MTQAPQPTIPNLADSPSTLDAQTLDALFPSDPQVPVATAAAPQAVPAAPTTPQAAPPPSNEPFVQGSKTVYKTREAAVEGINQKDTLIEQLRQQYSLATGIDPITRQPITTTTTQDNYATNPRKWAEDLSKARDPEELARVQQKFIWDAFAPIAPAIAQATRESAIKSTEGQIPEFASFYGGHDYQAALDAAPSLKEAIQAAEGDIRYHSRLPDLYKTAYFVSKGVQLPELLKRATPSTPSTPPPVTTQSSTTPVTGDSSGNASAPSLNSKAGRQALIAQFENAGLDKKVW